MVLTIAIEGPDGAGKSTLVRSIYDNKEELSNHIEIIKPTFFGYSSSELARKIGNSTMKIIEQGERLNSKTIAGLGYLLSTFPYYLAKKEAKRKGCIISDRVPWITNQIYLDVLAPQVSKLVNPLVNLFCERPDYILYLKTSSDVAYARTKKKNIKQLHDSKRDLEIIVNNYNIFMDKLGDNSNINLITIETDNKPVEEVFQETKYHLNDVLKLREEKFIEELQEKSEERIPEEIVGKVKRIKYLLNKKSVKARLSRWYEEGKIDAFEGSDILNSLNRSTYILENYSLFFGIGCITPPGIGSLISCPSRFFWTVGNRIYWNVRRDKEKSKIHGLDIAFLGAIPMIGGHAHLLSLYRENPKLYSLVKEHCYDNIVKPELERFSR